MADRTGGHITIDGEDKEPFAKVPVEVLKDGELSAGARLLYGILMWLGWREAWNGQPGYAGQQAVAEDFALAPRSVERYFSELRAGGYIQTVRVGLGEPDDLTVVSPAGIASEIPPD